MGREIQERILDHVNAHRIYYKKNPLIIDYSKCDDVQKDAQYVLESILRAISLDECVHKNPWNNGYCHELTIPRYFRDSWDTHIQELIWGLLSSNKGHREGLLDLEREGDICHHSHMAAEIAHDSDTELSILSIRLYNYC